MNEKKTSRLEVTDSQIDLAADLLTDALPGGLGAHVDELLEYEIVYQLMSNMCRRAAEVHAGLQVPWPSMCWSAHLPSATSHLGSTQDKLEILLGPLGVDVVRQDNWKKGAALPNFRPATITVSDPNGLLADDVEEVQEVDDLTDL